jgi:ribosomal protein S18 acetylase RimI-like enzyme
MEIRPTTADDVESVGRVHALSRNAAYVGLVPDETLARITPTSQTEHWRARWAAQRPPYAMYVATVEGWVEGLALGSGRGDEATLSALHVVPALHGTGAGQALHDRLLADFASWGCRTAVLSVLAGNERAQSFYRRNGWVHDGSRASHNVGGLDVPVLRYRRPVSSCATRR